MAKHYWINGTDNYRTLTVDLATDHGDVAGFILKSSAAVTTYFGTGNTAIPSGYSVSGDKLTYKVLFNTTCTGGATISSYVLWKNTMAYSNTASLNNDVVYTYAPATKLTVTPTATTVWNDAAFSVTGKGDTGSRATASTCKIKWTHTAGTCITQINNTSQESDANAAAAITWGTGYVFTGNAAYSFTISASHTGGAASSTSFMSPNNITGKSANISVKNAVTGVKLKDNTTSTTYVASGSSVSLPLTFTIKSTGKPYSYVVSPVRSAGAAANSTYALDGNSATAAGNLKVTGGTPTSTLQQFYVTSSQSSSTRTSGTVKVGVTGATATKSINSASSTVSFTYGAGTFVAGSGATNYVTYSTSNGTASITFKKAGGSAVFTMSSGATYTVTTTGRTEFTSIALNPGDKGTVAVPSSAASATSNNTSVCTVSLSGGSCAVTAVGAGTTTVSLGNGDSFKVTVENITIAIS